MTYQQYLLQAGLSKDQAALYETLVSKGELPAARAAKESGVPRTLAYVVLKQLETMGLVEKREDVGKVAQFAATHPLRLQEIAEQKKKEAEVALAALKDALPELSSAYGLALGKPGIRFFEGFIGVQHVLNDSLSAKEIIRTYADLAAIRTYIPDINATYVKERARRKVEKRGLVPDTEENRGFVRGYDGTFKGVTDTKFIQCDKAPFSTVMQIYDNKVSYISLGTEHLIGVILEDPRIYTMHKTLFDHLWAVTPEISEVAGARSNTA